MKRRCTGVTVAGKRCIFRATKGKLCSIHERMSRGLPGYRHTAQGVLPFDDAAPNGNGSTNAIDFDSASPTYNAPPTFNRLNDDEVNAVNKGVIAMLRAAGFDVQVTRDPPPDLYVAHRDELNAMVEAIIRQTVKYGMPNNVERISYAIVEAHIQNGTFFPLDEAPDEIQEKVGNELLSRRV